MEEYPTSLIEWQLYVETLEEKAYAVSDMAFSKNLLEEGYTPKEEEEVFRNFSKELDVRGLNVPEKTARNLIEE